MGETTGIAWTDHTFNPWWGCEKVSPGCKFCYAEAFADKRMHLKIWGAGANRRFFSDKHWAEPLKWNALAKREDKRHRVFCASMADVFEDRIDLLGSRARLFVLIENTPHLQWQLLTKRPENVRELAARAGWTKDRWPSNAWLGTTAEDQEHADKRVPELLRVDGPSIRFVSYEPAIGPVHFGPWLRARGAVNWIICGGESGPKARPFHLDWARQVLRECNANGTAFFMKQTGENAHGFGHEEYTGEDCPKELRPTGKGADPAEWPADLRVQRFPVST